MNPASLLSPADASGRIALVVLGLAFGGSLAYAQTPGTSEPLLGRAHLWVKVGRADLSNDAAREWGVNRQDYLAVEAYFNEGSEYYLGGELGRFGAGRTTTADGDTIRNFDFLWLELNDKKAFDLERGLSVDVGLGGALFYVDGEEVSMLGGQEVADALADFGFGAQVFADFNWRTRRLLVGLDAKSQWAFDIININYSNLRLGAHIGVTF